ncbi:ABC transporter substrate-binding protein [Muricoccus radiodurans]|uniref:ABC transporter substrate-binding protein n=1 Tax=Muricoccus radiodurans TaxID=2231721 RepID=UPI003CEACD8D
MIARVLSGLLGAVGLAVALSAPTAADPLRIGLSAPITTLDPHFYSTSPNNVAAFHVYDRLLQRSPEGRVLPGLATAWRPVSETTWEFALRPGVTWHDGTPFTAADVAFTIERAKNVPNNLGGYENLVRPITQVEVVNPLTIRLTTAAPTPNLPGDLTFIAILSSRAAREATTADFNAGRVSIGTGPYRFVSFTSGDRLVLARNGAWWGPRQAWESVTIRMVTNIAARTAALLAGDLDIIEAPSASDLPRLRADGRVSLFAVPGGRIAYVNPIYQQGQGAEPITDKEGRPLAENPLRNLRVRQALSMAINRTAIAERILGGTGVATGQWLPPGSYSYVDDVGVPAFDPARARALLTEAGYPNGFRITLSTANDRTAYAVEIVQAIAQMWARIGVETAVEGLPFSVYSPRGSRQQFQAYFGSLGNPTMEAGLLLRNLLMTVNPATGAGTYNWSRYSNAALDALITRALTIVDDTERERVLIEAERMALADVSFLPIYQFQNIWATRRGLQYEARADELTFAMGVRRAQ